jgi:hypothetical protein
MNDKKEIMYNTHVIDRSYAAIIFPDLNNHIDIQINLHVAAFIPKDIAEVLGNPDNEKKSCEYDMQLNNSARRPVDLPQFLPLTENEWVKKMISKTDDENPEIQDDIRETVMKCIMAMCKKKD